MTRVVVTTGDEAPGIREALDYLAREYLIPDTDVRSVTVKAEVGQPVLFTVSVYMNEPGAADVHPALARRLRQLGWTPPAMPPAPLAPKGAPVLACPECGGCCLAHGGKHVTKPYVCMDNHRIVTVADPMALAEMNGGCAECGAWRVDGLPPLLHKDGCSQGRR